MLCAVAFTVDDRVLRALVVATLGVALTAGFVWIYIVIARALARPRHEREQAARELQIQMFNEVRGMAIRWLEEKKTFRSLEADAAIWENWLDNGATVAASLRQTIGSLDEEQKAEIGELEARVRQDLNTYESARAIVAMQLGSRPPKGQGAE